MYDPFPQCHLRILFAPVQSVAPQKIFLSSEKCGRALAPHHPSEAYLSMYLIVYIIYMKFRLRRIKCALSSDMIALGFGFKESQF
jgi:hypothetical protein